MKNQSQQYDQLKILFSNTSTQLPSDIFTDKVMQMVAEHAEAQHSDEKLFNIWYWLTGLVILFASVGLLYYFDVNLVRYFGFDFDIKPGQIILFFSNIYKGIVSFSDIIQSKNLGILIVFSLMILAGIEFLLQRKMKMKVFFLV